jgi:NADPH:quinone reductase-like Zn-dependent oxidoreductase
MRNISICGSQFQLLATPPDIIKKLSLEGIDIFCGLIHTPDVTFDRNAPENASKVLIRKRAFSCNYRDKSFILKMAVKAPSNRFFTLGSEFVAEVVATGEEVTDLQIGDRVIENCCYPEPAAPGLRPGIPTNSGSREYQVFHQAQLLKIPAEMPDEVAAAFSIGGQTTYSMIRKLDLKPGANVLVTAAKSNTSLFAINALKQLDVNVYATSTSVRFEQQLKELGVKQLIQIDPTVSNWFTFDSIKEVCQETGGFDGIIDPFFDLHIGKVVPLLAPNRGKYITCGLYDQYSHITERPFEYHGMLGRDLFAYMMLHNLQIIGNCLGTTKDLQHALHDYATGQLAVVIDSVFTETQVKEFFERTYHDANRFGKVIYRYESGL